MDHFAPVAPSHVRALVLPVGRIERDKFLRFVQRLQTEASVIPLADIQQKTDDDAFFLSPKAFPQGSLLYRFSPAAPSDQQHQLSPFELFREPLLVLGVVDATQEASQKELGDAAAYLKEKHPRVVHRQLIVLKEDENELASRIGNEINVANVEHDNDPSLRQAVCEVSARFLVELTTYAKAMQASPTIQTPGQTARSLQRTTSLRENEKRPSTGHATPPPSGSVSSPTDDGSPAPTSRVPPLPATSFDQIPGANSTSSGISRPDSRASDQSAAAKPKGKSARASSQDRVSVQGFGSSTSQEKARIRGRARVGIVVGSIYLMAGHWKEALRLLVEHTTKARSLSDHLWHAKGLENMIVCMLLLAWSGVEFQVPSICDPVTDRTSSPNVARLTAEAKAASEGTKQQLQIFRLSVAIPDMAKLILSLYRSTEGSLELPFLCHAEATVRMSKLLAALSSVKGQLTPAALRLICISQYASSDATISPLRASGPAAALGNAKLLSKIAIADMLAFALPTPDDNLAISDHIRILSGVVCSYAMLGLERKKAITIKDLVVRLTGALIQARKLGAAEMGIHPAAAISLDTGADTIRAISEESGGINDLVADVVNIYGASLIPPGRSETPIYLNPQGFGNQGLTIQLLGDLINFCEASPEPFGVLWLTSSVLRTAGPYSAIDAAPFKSSTNAFNRQEQMHLATVISQTVAASRHLGLSDVQATYWDPFLVRGVEIQQAIGEKAVIDRQRLIQADGVVDPKNPLLYDPNASRPGTATTKKTYVLVDKEPSECLVTLQNPFDIPVDIENLELVTDGVPLSSHHEPVTLGPLRFQQIRLMISPQRTGPTKITGCRVKMQGCVPQVFPIVSEAWSAKTPMTIKELGLQARPPRSDDDGQHDLKNLGVDPEIIDCTVLDALPTLVFDNVSDLESGLMLLEGENRHIRLLLRNTSPVAAAVFEIKTNANVRKGLSVIDQDDAEKNLIPPGECLEFDFELHGKAGISRTQANFFFCSQPVDTDADEDNTTTPARSHTSGRYARMLSVPVDMTVNAALQIHNLEVTESEAIVDDALVVSYDIRNAWPKSISYSCSGGHGGENGDDNGVSSLELSNRQGFIAPGEIRRVFLMSKRGADAAAFGVDDEVLQKSFLSSLVVRWSVDGRSGVVDMQSLSMSPESLDLIRAAPVDVNLLVVEDGDGGTKQPLPVGSFVRVRVKISNRAQYSGPLFVQLQPRTSEAGRDDRRLAVAGTLQRVVSPPKEGEEARLVDFVLCPLLAGVLQLEALVKRAQIGAARAEESEWCCRKALALRVQGGS
ncbi:hypothetical protein M409DRAFT_69857 [Zasmidium cellare ATCC 36951]|uniref:Hypercellular protein HypA n=1 Tax=Zasmidium cellare ATCC 36951 TaxID=1080233 RepID=A0A6A6C2G1_ZASCE|nr:uncharacterized protein M409DRAFT_69857 [Zasmidium cellare ATCC 36951]KAF2161231.1 hypothetical protein M409DRAFT_69857 [Zasmidium cellare ATCC 36951]